MAPWNQTNLGLKFQLPRRIFSGVMLEIRPIWDWNLFISRPIRKFSDLKSDQFGIEIIVWFQVGPISPVWALLILEIRPIWDWNATDFIMKYRLIRLEIRPIWDWNDEPENIAELHNDLKSDQFGIEMKVCSVFVSVSSSWNQTNLGLKSQNRYPSCQTHTLEIRPIWDWNPADSVNWIGELSLKSDQFGIEILLCFSFWNW